MTPERKITVLVAEDHMVVRQGLCAVLNTHGDFQVVAEARTGREAVELASTLKPDVILMDIAMPVLNGIEATRQILTATPSARIVILSGHSGAAYVQRMIEAGVVGFLEKQTSAEMLAQAIHAVAQGGTVYGPSIAQGLGGDLPLRGRVSLLRPRGNALTARESEVLQLVAEGFANKQTAVKLGNSIKTVEKHRST